MHDVFEKLCICISARMWGKNLSETLFTRTQNIADEIKFNGAFMRAGIRFLKYNNFQHVSWIVFSETHKARISAPLIFIIGGNILNFRI